MAARTIGNNTPFDQSELYEIWKYRRENPEKNIKQITAWVNRNFILKRKVTSFQIQTYLRRAEAVYTIGKATYGDEPEAK